MWGLNLINTQAMHNIWHYSCQSQHLDSLDFIQHSWWNSKSLLDLFDPSKLRGLTGQWHLWGNGNEDCIIDNVIISNFVVGGEELPSTRTMGAMHAKNSCRPRSQLAIAMSSSEPHTSWKNCIPSTIRSTSVPIRLIAVISPISASRICKVRWYIRPIKPPRSLVVNLKVWYLYIELETYLLVG